MPNNVNKIIAYPKYSLNNSKVTPPAVIAKITRAGVPKLPAYVVIKEVSKSGFFLPRCYPRPTIRNTGNKTSKSFK